MSRQTKTFTERIRELIDQSGQTRYAISKATEIDQATLSRFMTGKGGLSLANLDALSKHLGWKLSAQSHSKRSRGKQHGQH